MSKLWKKLTLVTFLLCLTGCPTPPKSPPRLTPLNPSIEGRDATGRIASKDSPPGRTRSSKSAADLKALRAQGEWIWLDKWSNLNGLGALKSNVRGASQVFENQSSRTAFSVTIGSRLATWNGLRLDLGFEPKLVDGRPVIHLLDAQKNFEPLLRARTDFPKGKRVIVLDPGHGGKNTGAQSVENSIFEKAYTLDWALRTKPLLAARGWTVWLTRSEEKDMSLDQRVAFADNMKADLFLSLHFNSAGRSSTSSDHGGFETYCLTSTGMRSNLTRGYEDDPKRIYPNNAFDSYNLQFAMRLHRSMIRFTGRRDRGVRRARFMTVLQGQKRPAVLLEGGYLSDAKEAKLIASAAYRQRLAEAVAAALQ